MWSQRAWWGRCRAICAVASTGTGRTRARVGRRTCTPVTAWSTWSTSRRADTETATCAPRCTPTPAFRPHGLDHRVTTANTHVVLHEGRLLALEEGGFPYELTAELDTVGPFTFDGRLAGAMTAHPKRCPRTGDLLFFGYSVRRPFLTYHCAPGDGGALRSVAIELPACSLMHDFAITATKVLFVDSCLVFDLAAAAQHRARRGDGTTLVPRGSACSNAPTRRARSDGSTSSRVISRTRRTLSTPATRSS